MSLKQRRDHKPLAPNLCDEDCDHEHLCMFCADPIERIEVVGYDRTKSVSQRRTVRGYWRHQRRWHRKPA